MALTFTGSARVGSSGQDEEGFLDKTAAFVQYGLSSAAVSAGLSFYNTGVAFGNMFGLDAEKADTEETLRGLGWESTANYYEDNKTFVDAVGFGLGSLVPGMAGIKALRAGQRSISAGTRLSTGFRKAALPEDAIELTRQSIYNKGHGAFAEYKANRLGLVLKGFQQQAFEAAAYEGAVLATMNQSPSITGEDLNYFEGITSNLGGAAFGLVLGGLGGGAIQAYATLGSAKALVKEAELLAKDTFHVATEGVNNRIIRGDRIVTTWDTYNKAKSAIEAPDFTNLSPGIQANRRAQIEAAKGKLQVDLLDLAEGDTVMRDEMWGLLSKINGESAFADGAKVIAGVQRIRNWAKKDNVFEVPVSSVAHVLRSELNQRGITYKKATGSLMTEEEVIQYFKNTDGFMLPNRSIWEKGLQGVADVRSTKQPWEVDWDDIFTWRHESGHTLLNRPASEISQKSALGKRLIDQAIELSRYARPKNWYHSDQYESLIKQYIAGEEVFINPVRAQEFVDYMHMPEELFADAYAMMTNPRFGVDVAKDFPDLYKFMYGNKALGAKLNPGTAAIEVATGKLLDKNITPTIADMGGPVKITKSFVQWGEGGKNRVPLNTEFNVLKLKRDEANALFTAAATRRDIRPNQKVDRLDLPRLTAAMVQKIPVKIMDGNVEVTGLFEDIEDALLKGKYHVGQQLIEKSNKAQAAAQAKGADEVLLPPAAAMSPEEIARYIDTGPEFVNKLGLLERSARTVPRGVTPGDFPKDMTIANTLNRERDIPFWSIREGIDPTRPSYIMMDIDSRAIQDDNWIRGALGAHTRIKAEREFIDANITGVYWGEDFKSLPQSSYATDYNFALNISSTDSTSNFVKSANADFDSGTSTATYIGKQANRMKIKKHAEVDNEFDSAKVMLAADQDAVYEAAVLDMKLRQVSREDAFQFIPRTIEEFIERSGINPEHLDPDAVAKLSDSGVFEVVFPPRYDEAGELIAENQHLLWKKTIKQDLINLMTGEGIYDLDSAIVNFQDKLTTGQFAIKNQRLGKFWRSFAAHNATKIVPHKNNVYAGLGLNVGLDPDDLYPGAIDTSRFKFHALVVPTTAKGIMGSKDAGMILAKDAVDLENKVNQARAMFGEEIKVYTDPQIAEYKKAKAEYDNTLLFRDSYMDSALKKRGIAWDVLTEPDAQIFNQYTNSLKGQHTGLIRSTLELKYGEEVAALRQQASQADLYNSTFGKAKKARNVYNDTINIMLDKRPDDTSSIWNVMNSVTSEKFAQAWASLSGAVRNSVQTGDWELMNKKLSEYGLPEIYSASNELVLRHLGAPKPMMEKLISKANAFTGLMMLRLDSTQAIVNMASLPIMAVPEFAALSKLVTKDRLQVLRDGTTVKVPGQNISFPSSAMVMFQAVKNLTGPKGRELLKKYADQGLTSSVVAETAQLADDFAALAKEADPNKVDSFLTKALNKLATPSDWSEKFGKAIAANMAEQVLDAARVPEYMRSATINTFVNRVHGNYLASQRPQLFQGWMGQAVGLFQTYQFNLIQSFLRHVESGSKGQVAKMVGLQAGIFGAQSVPGFQLANQYIGEKSLENNDFYAGTNKLLGDEVGNFLLYGLASSSTIPITGQGIDLYSRGDLTPRTPILIPTSISEVPAISIIGNFVGSIAGATSKVLDGAPVPETMLQALAHNGLNRPLQGIAQLAAGQRTTRDGKQLLAFKGWDAWNTVTKLMGTKPLDEAIAASSFYRTASYKAARQGELDSLGESYREVVRAGINDTAVYMDFMQKYTERGGRAESFNRWVLNNHRNATESQITKLRDNNNSPQGRYLQQVMGADVEATVAEEGEAF